MKKTSTMRLRTGQPCLFGSDSTPRGEGVGCDIIAVGKRRDGGTRYWCLRHKADATAKYGKRATTCRTAHIESIPDEESVNLDLSAYAGGVALWGAVPPVYDTTLQPMDRGIHVHARMAEDSEKQLDRTFRAVRIVGKEIPHGGLYVDELDAIYYMATTVFGYSTRHVRCTHCGYSHLDRDWFSVHPHARHLCAGCGKYFSDTQSGIGNPICGVRDACRIRASAPRPSSRILNIRQADYPGGIQIWGSNPAFIWTSSKPEEEGIHVHAYRNDESPEVDETYGEVHIDGITLDSKMVRLLMAQAILPSLKDRLAALSCTSCRMMILSEGEFAFTPVTIHRCNQCGHEVRTSGRVRKVVSNPLLFVLANLAAFAVRAPRKHDLALLPETV